MLRILVRLSEWKTECRTCYGNRFASLLRSGLIFQEAVEEQTGLEVNHKVVSKVLRKEMQMGYRLAKTVPKGKVGWLKPSQLSRLEPPKWFLWSD